jgi:hypothetical protein
VGATGKLKIISKHSTELKGFTMPGKFEGEPKWVEILWDLVLSGMSDNTVHDGSTAYDGFLIDGKIAELTGYSEDPTRYVVLWESDNGFVNHTTMSLNEFIDIEGFDVEDVTSEWMPGIDPDFDDLGGEAGY